jgi:hypothetical protein
MVKAAPKKPFISPKDERALHMINQLEPKLKSYGHEWWRCTRHAGAQPDPRAFGLDDDQEDTTRDLSTGKISWKLSL